ncbi:MAG: glycosyltransferase [Methanosarcinales archaeon]|nr:glycosyltransferase [Methanosarcinales archaeon]
MKILHAPEIIAGQSTLISRAQRDLGLKSDVLVFNEHPFNYKYDICLNISKKSPIIKIISSLGINFVKCLFKYDVFHFHFRNSLLPYNIDLPILKLLGKKIIMHYHGSDIRGKSEGVMVKKFADIVFVSTPDLLKYVPNSTWIPNLIDLDELNYIGIENDVDTIKIIHAPTNRLKKGTEYVIKAIEKLKKEGYKINLILLENIPNNKVIDYYRKADIVIDQLLIGWYGVFSIECMALGKPVCVYIQEDLESYMPSNPVMNTSPKNIIENLKILIEDAKLRKELGEKGRKYVEEVHDSKKIAKQLIELYECI